MPKCPSYVCRNRHGTFYFRLVIPNDLLTQLPFTGREIRRSLRTTARKIAIQRARLLRVNADQYFALMRTMPKKKKMIRTEFLQAIDAFGELITVDYDGDAGTELTAMRQLIADSHELKSKISGTRAPDNHSDITISQVSEQFLAAKGERHHLKDRTTKEYQDAHQDLIFILGDRPIALLTNEDMEHFYQGLSGLPTSMRSDNKYKDKDFAELQEMTIPPNRIPTVRTREKKFSRIKALLNYAVKQDHITRNPADSVLVEKDQIRSDQTRSARRFPQTNSRRYSTTRISQTESGHEAKVKGSLTVSGYSCWPYSPAPARANCFNLTVRMSKKMSLAHGV